MSLHEVGEGIEADNSAWSFGGNTPEVFTRHARRSIPMYEIGHDIVCGLSDFFIHDDSLVYEIGVSTGELLGKLVERHAERTGVDWVGIDSEPAMVQRARRNPQLAAGRVRIECEDAVTYDFGMSDFIVSYYCLQFIPPKHRQVLVQHIYDTLEWGGGFVLFEKVRGPDARFQDILSLMYTDFKLANQYTPAEILGKSRSLKGVLEPFSSFGNDGLLRRAGFVDICPVFRHLCFEGVLAIK